MHIADDQGHTLESTLYQALQEGPPVHFFLVQGYRNTQNISFSSLVRPCSDQNSRISHLAILMNLLVACIQLQVDILA
jgi:hypothetical protein